MDEEASLTRIIEDYLADCRRRGLRPATLRYYETALVRFARSLDAKGLSAFDRDHVRAFQDSTPSLCGTSMRGYLRALRTFSTWLADEELTSTDRLAGLRLPRVDRTFKVVPTDPELVALLRASDSRLRILIAVLAGTGLRIGDVAGLDVSDMRDEALIVRTTKNRHGRLVPLDPIVGSLLEVYRRDCRPRPAADDDALFVNRLGLRLTPSGARQALDEARRRAGLAIQVSPHVLRHWFARDLASHGTSDRVLASRMGWTASSLDARYAPVSEGELRTDVARYSPLPRLQAAGLLEGVLPIVRRRSAVATARSKRLVGAAEAGRPGAPRRS